MESIASAPLESARSLPFASYVDPDIYTLERAQIFHKDWIFVCAEQELKDVGSYYAFKLADEPVVIVRGKDSQLHAMSNVCRHRGTILCEEGMGISTRFVCPYHGWTYDTKGVLIGIPHQGSADIDKAEHCLPQFRVDTWEGLVFVTLSNDAPSLSKKLAGIEPYLRKYQSERFQISVPNGEEEWSTNWKLAMENAMESYHLFRVHTETLEAVTPTREAFYIEGGRDWTLTGGKIINARSKVWDFFAPKESAVFENYLLISIPPSFVGIITYDSWNWISVLPISPQKCSVRNAGLYESKPASDKETMDFVQAFFAEDKAICERVQSGMHATHSQGGRLVELERVVVDFHHYLASMLFEHT